MKYYGSIGYSITSEVRPGVWMPENVEKEYYGDVLRFASRSDTPNKVNDDITLQNQISIVADPFTYQNFHFMKYVTYMGAKWRITNVEVQQPRLVLSVGGIYNDEDEE